MSNLEQSYGVIPLRRGKKNLEIFIVLQKNGNHWGFPKGKPEPNETPLECAKRELFEETGLKVKKTLSSKSISEKYCYSKKGKVIQKKVDYFAALVEGKFDPQPSEILDGVWASLDKAFKMVTFREAKNLFTHLKPLTEIAQ